MTSPVHRRKLASTKLTLSLQFLLLILVGSVVAKTSISLKDCPTEYAPKSSSCTCTADSLTTPSISLLWKDPERKIVQYSHGQEKSVTLSFADVEPRFNGTEYICEVVDEADSAPNVISYTPKVADPPSPPRLILCPTGYVLPTDENANCTCVTAYPGVPPALLVWEDPNQVAVMFTQSAASLSLPFTAVTANFSRRQYQCNQRHVTGDHKVFYTAFLAVEPDIPQVEGYRDWYVQGDRVWLKCIVGNGIPDTQKIIFNCTNHPDQPDKIEASKLTSSLVFQAKMADNNAHCMCYGTNEFLSSRMHTFTLHVGSTRPRISLDECPKYFAAGISSCTCVAHDLGNSSATLLWTDPNGQTVSYNMSSRLVLTQPDKKFNNSTFRCDLLHSTGLQSMPYTLNFAVPPTSPRLVGCPKSREGADRTDASCTCRTSSLGVPAAVFLWEDPHGNPVYHTQTETSLVLKFRAVNDTFFQKAYRCILRHITGDLSVKYISLKGGPRSWSSRLQVDPIISDFGLFAVVCVYWFVK